ncbi:aminotransferase class IV [Dyadobacter sp. Leaf189]|uniref:aminotransferase class IV n=1 Tax=Dyadobacter sp. Leaf189 TaxID=1736295 RepID=UPI0006F40C08|nr:aminotransferase class IV [Dyadobacter sp. Leaf189]KQS23804.1 hypothetical protein ASG33_24590 [Dyadobacter sp. Leaf189]
MLCIETICVENRKLKNLAYHEARLNKTRKKLWGYTDHWNLAEMLEIPETVSDEMHKCRLAYSKEIDNIKWEPQTLRTVKSIRRVYSDTVDYSYKYDKREELNTLFAQRKESDEILIIKNGWVTDAYYYNVAFSDGKDWFTPTTCLLPGTKRAYLLDQGIIREREISETDIFSYNTVRLFNAMINWETAPEIDTKLID